MKVSVHNHSAGRRVAHPDGREIRNHDRKCVSPEEQATTVDSVELGAVDPSMPSLVSDIRSAVGLVRQALKRQMNSETREALTPEQLDGWCELAEAIEYHHLSAMGYAPEELHSNQVGELGGSYRHAFLIVGRQCEQQIVDPTFAQFLNRGPGQSLEATEDGRGLLCQLLEEGHAPWNRQSAELYAQAMQIPGDLHQKALDSERPMLYQPALFQNLLV